jgi:pimeloyl-ACP methyl ester carboxylesterase
VRLLLPLLTVLALAVPATAGAVAPSIVDAPVRTVAAGQGKIGYRSIGTGRPLVLVMGVSGTIDDWPPPFVDALARHHRVIVPDSDGIGRTTLGPAPLTIRRMGLDVASLIGALKLGRVDVLGWSMGGMIAQSLAADRPKLVRRLVLAATAPGDGKGTLPGPDGLKVLAGLNLTTATTALFPAAEQAAGRRYVRDITSYPDASNQAPAAVTQAQLGATAGWIAGQSPSGLHPERLKLPVLIGAGAQDFLLPPANDRHLAQVLPDAKLRVYADAGHGFLFQDSASWLRAVDAFLG